MEVGLPGWRALETPRLSSPTCRDRASSAPLSSVPFCPPHFRLRPHEFLCSLDIPRELRLLHLCPRASPTLHCTLRVLHAPAHPSKPSPNFPPLGRLPAAPSPRQNQSHNASVRTAFCTLRNLIFSRHVCARTHTHRHTPRRHSRHFPLGRLS